ncbi:hypothetical protein HG531_007980 [Fusarium graminearum]|nr:hypothetical protein HG531_007980 [Fusarium graminearum]
MATASTCTQAWIQHLQIVNVRASLRGLSVHLNKEYHYHILTLINSHRRPRRLRPALYITLILPRARISIILLDLLSILQLHRRLLTLRPRNRITNPIVAIMSQSPILLFKNTTDSNTRINIRSNIRSNIHHNTHISIRSNIRSSTNRSTSNSTRLCLHHRRIQRITRTRLTAQEILR